ncbi:hypothetical protein GCM10011611_31670 [Aliidongia dinghuensis]|uniref:Uncharacterized protein n=1 Tax=Aliidongia dinghuensis TaxID=1867774 RepID=A0A8J3E410_9PROT|nr:hypothetical protein [Aliidongia dinghuensis]GGF23216.1 hypothetical protein GCM10011611_31670 [Aliidongia dinghuensis]
MRPAILFLLGVVAVAGPALADPVGRPGVLPPVFLPPPPSFTPPVPQPMAYPPAPAANNPVDQQKQSLYRTELQSHQRELATEPPQPGSDTNALTTQQALDRLRLQAPN